MHQAAPTVVPSFKTDTTTSEMTASTSLTVSPNLNTNSVQSLEDLHFNLAQEITRAMASSQSSSPYSPVHPAQLVSACPTNPIGATIHTHTQRRSNTLRKPKSTIVKNINPVQLQTRAPAAKPSPMEEELVRRIHRKVGGPSKLSTYDDPAKVRHVVIEALAREQSNLSDAARIRKGQLSVFERRVVRTVTNRGAAVRSRMRQRKEVAHLKNELRLRDVRVRQLENTLRALCSKFSVPLPKTFYGPELYTRDECQKDYETPHHDAETEAETDSVETSGLPPMRLEGFDAPDFALDQEIFGNIVDQMITHPSWY